MSVISWNIRGLGNSAKIILVRDIIKQESLIVVFLQEIKLEEPNLFKSGEVFWYALGLFNHPKGLSNNCAFFGIIRISPFWKN